MPALPELLVLLTSPNWVSVRADAADCIFFIAVSGEDAGLRRSRLCRPRIGRNFGSQPALQNPDRRNFGSQPDCCRSLVIDLLQESQDVPLLLEKFLHILRKGR